MGACESFCVHGSNVLSVDTTCEIIDNLWLIGNLWLQRFLAYIARIVELNKNPFNDVKKGDGGTKPRRNKTGEIQLFVPFQQPDMPQQQITLFKIQRVEGENCKIVKVHKVPNIQSGSDLLKQKMLNNIFLFIEKIIQTAPNKLKDVRDVNSSSTIQTLCWYVSW